VGQAGHAGDADRVALAPGAVGGLVLREPVEPLLAGRGHFLGQVLRLFRIGLFFILASGDWLRREPYCKDQADPQHAAQFHGRILLPGGLGVIRAGRTSRSIVQTVLRPGTIGATAYGMSEPPVPPGVVPKDPMDYTSSYSRIQISISSLLNGSERMVIRDRD